MPTIIIDAGHGPNTAGKRSPDGLLREFNFNKAVADFVQQSLIKEGLTVHFAHDNKIDVPLTNRANFANNMHADAFVSIHANAHGADWNNTNGIETYIYPTASQQSKVLASLLQGSLIAACHRTDRGVKTANFAVLRETHMPAALIECGFMTNREENALLLSKTYREQCAKAITFAITAWLYRGKK